MEHGFQGAEGASAAAGETVWSVAQLNRQAGRLLESGLGRLWIRGEVSNFTRAASGHWYFSIKDEAAAVRAVMFRGRTQALDFMPRAGEQFEFRVQVSLYEPRGDFQVQVETLRRAGRGDLHEAFLRLKAKLEAEGLFDPARKCMPARVPRAVGVVTSLGAAALRDVLSAMRRRAPHVSVIIYPAPVQGVDAAPRLVAALQQAVARGEVETLLLVRGGGSLEDLWSFNDEALARAVAHCPLTVISGVGHETDFTLVDFAADLRAPTPTAAAELACEDRQASQLRWQRALQAQATHLRRKLEQAALRLDRAAAGLVSPQQRLHHQADRLRQLGLRLDRGLQALLRRAADRQGAARRALELRPPALAHRRAHSERLGAALAAAARRQLELRRQRLAAASATLRALDPSQVVARGYAIVRDSQGGLVTDASALAPGDVLEVALARGALDVAVKRVR